MSEDKILISNVKVRSVVEDNVTYDVQTDVDGAESWFLSGTKTLHRIGKPAITHPNGDECWYLDGYLERSSGPAITKNNGKIQYWYRQSRLERLDGGPAVINEDGKFWYKNHLLDRINGLPAAEWNSGLHEWYSNGVFQKDNDGRVNSGAYELKVGEAMKVKTNTDPVIPAVRKPRTQKARSILNGCLELQEDADFCHTLRGFGSRSSVMMVPVLIQTEKDILDIDPSFWTSGKKIFARPCPMTPRHGFVDSRVIKDKAALRRLYNRTKKIDPDGEIVLTTFLEGAVCNAILTTSGTLSIGPGHDGATAGKDSFSIPVKPDQLRATVRRSAGVIKYDNCFVESVFTPTNPNYESFYFTQVRGGPVIESAVVDFVPAEMVVEKIIPPNDDLVQWEAQVKKLAPGTVVYGPGHTLASHAAIHCVINNVPFITSFEPKVGERVKPMLAAPSKLSLRDFKVGGTLGIDMDLDMCHMLHTSMAIIHNWAYIRNSKHSSWLLGLSASFFIKVMCTLSFGEYRYAGSAHLSREEVYKTVYKSDKFGSYMKHCPQVAHAFTSGIFNSGYGGKKWANATYMCIDIWNLMAEINDTKFDADAANKMVELLNKATNLVHNNGWLFNKISSKNLMNFISKSPGLAILQLADVLHKCYVARQKLRQTRKIVKIQTNNIAAAVPAEEHSAPPKPPEPSPVKEELPKAEVENKNSPKAVEKKIANPHFFKKSFTCDGDVCMDGAVMKKMAQMSPEDMYGYPSFLKDESGSMNVLASTPSFSGAQAAVIKTIKEIADQMKESKIMSMPPPGIGIDTDKSNKDKLKDYYKTYYNLYPPVYDMPIMSDFEYNKPSTSKKIFKFDAKDCVINTNLEEKKKTDEEK